MWRVIRLGAVSLLALTLLAAIAGGASAAEDVGPDRVYFPQTGHYLAYGFLDYWHHNGDIQLFGYPVSEELTDAGTGLTVQYFERAVFEWNPALASTWHVQLRRIGSEVSANRLDEPPFWRVVAANDPWTTYFAETGHRLSNAFQTFWLANNGLRTFGYPISEEFVERGTTVQYFERARFEWHLEDATTGNGVWLGRLGVIAADLDRVDLSRVPKSATVAGHDPDLWYVPPPPGPIDVRLPAPGAPTDQPKWIEIDLSDQYLRAWEYRSVVYGSYVSTGVTSDPTPTGAFHLFAKYRFADLTEGTASAVTMSLPNVPWVMYFYGDHALHATSWHDEFGTPMSRGSVNLPVEAAAWLYTWAPYEATVWIHA